MWKRLVAAVLGFILCTAVCMGSASADNSGDQAGSVVVNQEFEELDSVGLLELMQTGVKQLDIVDSNIVCAMDSNGKCYICVDPSEDVLAYVESVCVKREAMAAKAASEAAAKKSIWSDYFIWKMLGFFGLSILAIVALRMRQTRMNKLHAEASASVPAQVPGKQAASSAVENVPRVRFEDVEGVQGLKDDVMRVVDCLVHPDRYRALGARMPKGVILYGPPGTGKTLIAKAIAGEACVPFLSACGSDFVEKYVGVAAKRVRELYEKARRQAPCIVFIDEVDAIAASRGTGENSERDQAVNALLAELDGFGDGGGVVTICATNRLEMLDDAFKRAGRFDLKLAVGLPDLDARERILKIHSRNKPLSDDIVLHDIAKRCAGFSGADLESLMNESAMSAAMRGGDVITPVDIDEAFFKIVMQGNRKPLKSREEMTRIIAWHEAGHTLATKLLTDDSVPSVTIVGSSSGAGGVTFRTPAEEGLKSRKYLKSLVCVMYAGRAAEELYLGDPELVTTGAQQDIKQATGLIRDYIASYGMGDRGMLDLSQFQREYGSILDEAREMAGKCYSETVALLDGHRAALDALASGLLDKETLDEDEIDAIIARAA